MFGICNRALAKASERSDGNRGEARNEASTKVEGEAQREPELCSGRSSAEEGQGTYPSGREGYERGPSRWLGSKFPDEGHAEAVEMDEGG